MDDSIEGLVQKREKVARKRDDDDTAQRDEEVAQRREKSNDKKAFNDQRLQEHERTAARCMISAWTLRSSRSYRSCDGETLLANSVSRLKPFDELTAID